MLWLFGFNFGVTSEGTVKHDDCRQIISLKSGSWQTYIHNFTCETQKTQSGAIMGGLCVAIRNSGFFGTGDKRETAYVYWLPLPTTCRGNVKGGVAYPYLGYDDMCYTTPQDGEKPIDSTQ